MKTIPLTHGMAAIVDDEDYDSLSQYKWSAHGNCGHWYPVRYHNKTIIRMTHVILGMESHRMIWFRNGDSLDCRKDNLELRDTAEYRAELRRRYNAKRRKEPRIKKAQPAPRIKKHTPAKSDLCESQAEQLYLELNRKWRRNTK